MKKCLILVVATMFALIGGTVNAMPIMWDVSAAGSPGLGAPFGDADTLTGVFDQFGFDAQTTSTFIDSNGSGVLDPGDTFTDIGDLRINGLIASAAPDEEGLGLVHEVTATWSDLGGVVTGFDPVLGRLDVVYTMGTIDFYLDTSIDSAFANPAGTTPPSGAGGANFADGVQIASLNVEYGEGHTFFGGLALGAVDLVLTFNSMLPGFWLDDMGNDLEPTIPFLLGLTDMNIDTPTPAGTFPPSFIAYSNENGSGLITTIPEPASMLLVGSGLMGLAGLGRRRFSKK